MDKARLPAVAGMFYPADPHDLATMVDDLLHRVRTEPDSRQPDPRQREAIPPEAPTVGDAEPPKALLVPHAGYAYSGPTAARGYVRLDPVADRIRRVVLLGPVHRVPIRGLALPDAHALRTPLGDVPVAAGLDALRAMPQVGVHADAHRLEHSLEVHLPFLQRLLGEIEVVPLVVGTTSPEEVAEVIDHLWGGPETVVVVSSDLSHYHAYDEAAAMDRATVRDVLAPRGALHHTQACGASPANGLLHLVSPRGLQPRLYDLCNSGDTAGDRQRVVGYASIGWCEPGRAAGPVPGRVGVEQPRPRPDQHVEGAVA